MFTHQPLSKVHKSSTVLMKRVSYTILHNHKHPPHPFLQPSRPTLLRENCTVLTSASASAYKCTLNHNSTVSALPQSEQEQDIRLCSRYFIIALGQWWGAEPHSVLLGPCPALHLIHRVHSFTTSTNVAFSLCTEQKLIQIALLKHQSLCGLQPLDPCARGTQIRLSFGKTLSLFPSFHLSISD